MQICICQLLSTDSNGTSFHLGDPTPSIHLLAVKVQNPRELLQFQSCRVIKSQLFRPWGKNGTHSLICDTIFKYVINSQPFRPSKKNGSHLPTLSCSTGKKVDSSSTLPSAPSSRQNSLICDTVFTLTHPLGSQWGDRFYRSNIHWFGQVVSDLYHIIGFVVFDYSMPFGTQ